MFAQRTKLKTQENVANQKLRIQLESNEHFLKKNLSDEDVEQLLKKAGPGNFLIRKNPRPGIMKDGNIQNEFLVSLYDTECNILHHTFEFRSGIPKYDILHRQVGFTRKPVIYRPFSADYGNYSASLHDFIEQWEDTGPLFGGHCPNKQIISIIKKMNEIELTSELKHETSTILKEEKKIELASVKVSNSKLM